MFKRLFLSHPQSIGESYLQHQKHAFVFGRDLIGAGLACIVHGLLPQAFETVASDTVQRLNSQLAPRRLPALARGPAVAENLPAE